VNHAGSGLVVVVEEVLIALSVEARLHAVTAARGLSHGNGDLSGNLVVNFLGFGEGHFVAEWEFSRASYPSYTICDSVVARVRKLREAEF